MRAHIDPATGQFLPDAPAGAAPMVAPGSTSRSAVGLRAVPLPGGGEMVHLQGRFRSYAIATVGEEGGVSVQCLPAAALPAAPPVTLEEGR